MEDILEGRGFFSATWGSILSILAIPKKTVRQFIESVPTVTEAVSCTFAISKCDGIDSDQIAVHSPIQWCESISPSQPFYYHVSHFHTVSLSCIWDGALPCAGWCDPQIDSFIHNDKRWVWTGLLIWQSLKCHSDGWRGGPPPLSPPTP